jgi:Flp pilus assembly protein TadG
MFHKNQIVQSFRRRQPYSGQPTAEGFGWRSPFSVCMRARYLAFRWNEPAGFQPRSGVRIQPTAQAVGKVKNRRAPAGRKSSSHARSFSAAIYALKSATASAAEVPKAYLLRGTEAAALIEFAVALPLLVVLVVGIFDFGGAFNLKQKLNNAVREGARFGASQPTNDLALGQPPSVSAIRYLVDSYLQTAGINDCGLSTAPEVLVSAYSWGFTGNTGCTTTLTVSRQIQVQETVGGNTVTMFCTTVNIVYPYQWHFNNVIQLLVPGANYTLGNIHSDATAVNMD